MRPMPAPQSTMRERGSGGGGRWAFEERRSLERKFADCCRSMRETWGKPPSMPLTEASVEDQ